MKKIAVRLQWSPQEVIDVGQLAHVDGKIFFEFDAGFLDRKLNLSPFKLPARPGLIEHVDRAFGALPGLIDDSLPDGWGRLLMDRMFRKRGLDPAAVSPLDRLTYLGTRTMGALTYHPPDDVHPDPCTLDLHELGKNARAALAGETTVVLPQLLRAGGSPGGARPKVLVGIKGEKTVSGENDLPDGFAHWIVKFSARQDSRDAGPVEYAYAAMARKAGIDFPETRLLRVSKTQSYFAVRRFDRLPANQRLHVHTFGNLIHANFRIPSTDYADLLNVTLALTRNHLDLLRAFRRMVFNLAAHNRDDHAKNFAFIMNPLGEWALSPAYDVTHSSGPGGEHMMTVAGEGCAPGREHVLKLAEQFQISRKELTSVIDDVNTALVKWMAFADEAGCTKKRSRAIASSFSRL
jgi:serine/threonine-protein kinase HipA